MAYRFVGIIIVLALFPAAASAAPCESLATFTLPNTKVLVTDGLIDDPTTCRFDPKILECKGTDANSCLTPAQVVAAQRIYSPAVNPRTRQEIFPALQPGSELGWGGLAGPQPVGEAVEFFQYVVYNDPM